MAHHTTTNNHYKPQPPYLCGFPIRSRYPGVPSIGRDNAIAHYKISLIHKALNLKNGLF